MQALQALDWVVIAGYFGLLLALSWWVMLRNRETSADYFLASHSLGWFVVGASIFASNIGSEHLVGLAGSGATEGVAMAHYELHAWCLLVLGWLLVPFYMRSKVFTMPQFLERRFSPASRYVLSIISLVAYVVTKIAVGIYAGGVVFDALLPDMSFGGLDGFWIGSVLVLVITGLYTALGGFRAVAYTEALQTIILIIGSALVTYYGLEKVGGWTELRETVGSDKFNLWKPLVPEGAGGTVWEPVSETNEAGQIVRQAWYFDFPNHFPWLGMLICAPVIGLWYWCTDQYIVQRALGAPDQTEARRGCIFAGYLKLLPVFIFIIPGVICWALILKNQSGETPDVNFAGMVNESGLVVEKEKAFPLMVVNVLPIGIRGVVVAGLLAALMSSLAGVFNACATLFTIDLYTKFHPHASERQLVKIGRIATAVMVLIGMMWIPIIRGSRGLYEYLQSVQGYLAPPIFVVFFLGIFWRRLNAQGCLAALVVGFAIGMFRLGVDTFAKLRPDAYAEGTFLWIVNRIYFQYFSIIILAISATAMVVVSYLTRQPDYARISGLTFGTLTEEDRLSTRRSWSGFDVAASIGLLALIVAAYLYFRG
jgi:SSS family solute:Na+ symporter